LGCIVVAGLLKKLGKKHASNPAHRRMRRGKKDLRTKKQKNMSATGIEPMTNHLGDRKVTIVLLGC
jgi:hypothetical protein